MKKTTKPKPIKKAKAVALKAKVAHVKKTRSVRLAKKDDKPKRKNVTGLVVKIVLLSIAAVYFFLLIAGKWMFGESNVFYHGINIFASKNGANIWLRSLSYVIFLLTLSYVVRTTLKQIAKKLVKGKAVIDLLCSFIKYIAAIALVFAVLSVWGVNTTALLAGVGIISLIVGLGAQPLIEDIIAGLFIVFEHVFEVGDIIVVDNFRGTVKEIGIRTTQIVDAGGNIKVVNNSDIRTLVNMTSQLSLAISEVDIEYGESLERVELVIKDNLENIKNNIPDIVEGPFYMGVAELGQSGVRLRFTAKCPESLKFQVERDMNRQIKLLFDKNKINIPFTQVVLHEATPISKPRNVNNKAAKAFVEKQKKLAKGLKDDEKD